MTSTSSFGSSVITLQFDLALNIDVAEQEVQAAVNASGTFLPSDLPNPPIYSKVNPADAPVLTLALTSSVLPLPQVQSLADTRLAPKISQLAGVGLVSISGGQKPAVRVQANPTALAAYGLSLTQLSSAIAAANANTAKGTFDGPHRAFTIDANDQLLSSAAYRPLVVAYRDGAPVRLSDVAHVIDSVEDAHQAAWMNTTPAVIVNVQRQPGANTIAVVDRIKALLPTALRHAAAVGARVGAHRSHDHHPRLRGRRAVRAGADRGAGGAGDLPLPAPAGDDLDSRRRRPAVADRHLRRDVLRRLQPEQPDADGADHLDRLRRRRRDRDDREHRALRRSGRAAARRRRSRVPQQIGFTIVSLTVSLIAVLIPLLFMGDIVGRLFREFAVTLERHDPGLGGRLADADADDVRANSAPRRRASSRDGWRASWSRRSTA